MSSGSTFQQFNDALGIGASCHVDGNFDRALAIREGPVRHLARDERSIRHDDFRTVRSANDAGPDADAADFSNIAAYLDDITDFNRTFKKQNQATFCNPNPIPTLNAPARIVTFVRSIPSAPRATKKPTSRMT